MGQKTEQILKRAKSFQDKGNNEQALRLFNQVLNREPGNRKALRNKALLKLINKDPDAEEFLLFAIDQQPGDDQLYQMLGSYYQQQEQAEKALAQFKKAIEINNDNILAHIGLGMVYSRFLNEHKRAVRHFSRAISLGNDSAEVYFSRGCSNMVLQNMKVAEEDLRLAADRGSDQAEELIDRYFG